MKPETNRYRSLLAALLTVAMAGPVAAFDLDSDIPIKVTADNARLDDGQGIATYTGDVELEQGNTRLHLGKRFDDISVSVNLFK